MGMADKHGGQNNFYVEDCDFHGGIGVSISTVTPRSYGGITSTIMPDSLHTDTTPSAYGMRHWEIYDNQFLFADLGDCDGSETLNLH